MAYMTLCAQEHTSVDNAQGVEGSRDDAVAIRYRTMGTGSERATRYDRVSEVSTHSGNRSKDITRGGWNKLWF